MLNNGNFKKAVFLDRDGVINRDGGYIHTLDSFILFDCVIEALRLLKRLDFELIVVSNQSGIGRGYFSADAVDRLHVHMSGLFEAAGCGLTDIFVCPHAPDDGCDCRKPAPGMLLAALKRHNIDPALSVIVGDKWTDMEAGLSAGLSRGFLIGEHNASALPESVEVVADLGVAALRLADEID